MLLRLCAFARKKERNVMKLQTKIPIQPQENQIDYSSNILLMGSCFVENIGAKLDFYKFRNLQNPFGILFHSIAIEKLIVRALKDISFSEKDIFFYKGQWHCFEVHSEMSSASKDEFLKKLNSQLILLKKYLLKATHIVFTYGTSWVYRFKETDNLVANCYKIPQQEFIKELLSVEEVSASIKNTLSLISEVNTKASIITTVSPVRHLKDGFVENTVSKAHLFAGLHQSIIQKSSIINHQSVYFPSYEIMMDELRDYRFYKEDMIHPNNLAISIIWEAFQNTWISSETKTLQKEISSIQNGLQHRPFNPESEEHKSFLKNLEIKISVLQKKIKHLKF